MAQKESEVDKLLRQHDFSFTKAPDGVLIASDANYAKDMAEFLNAQGISATSKGIYVYIE